jgi:rubrerythrin
MNVRTRKSVEAALTGEALAALRYQLFAQQARREGYGQVAELFASAGNTERKEHFKELAALIGLVGGTHENLRAALLGEVTEHRTLYPRFAALAREDGDDEVAARFVELAADEHEHADRLRTALEELESSEFDVVGG